MRKSKTLPAETGSQSVHFLNIYYKQDRSLLPYLFLSCLSIIGLLVVLFCTKNLFCPAKEDKLSQLIDIEFVSQSDFKDTKNLLPANRPKPSLAKRKSPVMQSKGQLFSDPVFIVRVGSNQSQYKEEIEDEAKQEDSAEVLTDKTNLTSRYLPMNVPFSPLSHQIPVKASSGKKTGKSNPTMDMEEVKPPELVEVKENEGDKSYEYWQDGGSSAGGTGISSSLADYLKELHSKLKHAWSPPPGTVHHVKVMFRLNKNGNLISMQLVQSCGNTIADESALTAIKHSAPFGKLPSDYTHQFLDLAYTFNYTTDELNEIHHETEE